MDTSFCTDALDEALEHYGPPETFNTDQVHSLGSTGGRNTVIEWGVVMAWPKGWSTLYTGRPALRSPGHPGVSHRRWRQQRFWESIAGGDSSDDAAEDAGVSSAVGSRWFRDAGGMQPSTLATTPTGRYLSCGEREDIAVFKAQGCGVRQIARRLGRCPSTISRELRRNAARRSRQFEYRASVGQWHADRAAKRALRI